MYKYKKHIIISLIFLITYILLNYIYLISNISYNIISSLLTLLYLLIFTIISFKIAKNSKYKGIYIGLSIGLIFIIILFILSLLFKCNISYKTIIYYFLILLSTIFASILSKNIKR